IPLERFQYVERSLRLGQPVKLLYVGSLLPEKGALTVVQAIAFLKQEWEQFSVILDIVGDGPERDSLVDYCRRSGLSNLVNFLGKVEHDGVPSFYRNHDIFIFPSIWKEPFGLTFLEAMASGTPVISTATGGNREFLVHGQNCLVFEAGNARELASRIKDLIEDASLYSTLSRNAAKEVRERFSLDMYVDRIEEILKGLALERKGRT
ncbi:MAG: glycosyltransferase family 4 protein, partial [candidate division NC10 bacterium]